MAAMSESLSENGFHNLGNSIHESGNNEPIEKAEVVKKSHKDVKCVTFYKNGDRYFRGIRIQLTPQRYLDFSHLLADLTKWISLPYGVRRLYSSEEGRLVDTFDAMLDGDVFVCASFEKFKHLQYGIGVGAPTFKGGQVRSRGASVPLSRNSHEIGVSPQVQRKTGSINQSTTDVPVQTQTYTATLLKRRGSTRRNPVSSKNDETKTSLADISETEKSHKNRGLQTQEPDKPKVLNIVRHGKRPRKTIKFLMPKKVRSVDQLLVDITNAFEPRYRTSKITKLYTIDGDEISKVDELIEGKDSEVFVGVGEHETVSSSDFHSVRREIYGKLKTVSKYSKIKSQVNSEIKIDITKPGLVKAPPDENQNPKELEDNLGDTTANEDSPTKSLQIINTSNESDHVIEKFTGKDSGIEDEDTPRESEHGSKVSLVDTSHEYDARKETKETKMENASHPTASRPPRVDKIRKESLNRLKNQLPPTSRDTPLSSEKQGATPTLSRKTLKADLPPLRDAKNRDTPYDLQARLKREQDTERERNLRNKDELDKREEQRERMWRERKDEMLRKVRSSATAKSVGGPSTVANRRKRRSESATNENRKGAPVEKFSERRRSTEDVRVIDVVEIEELTDASTCQGAEGKALSTLPENVIVESPQSDQFGTTHPLERLGNDFEVVDLEDEINYPNQQQNLHMIQDLPQHTSGIICDIRPNKCVHDRYSLGKQIGDGNFAVVRTCRARFGAASGMMGMEFAMKVIEKSKLIGKEDMVRSEVAIMKRCCHSNIIRLVEEFETKDNIYLVMELVKGGDLFDAISRHQKFEEPMAACMVRDVASALNYLHSSRIVHRDLKPENLLVTQEKEGALTLKLGDFGLAMVVDEPLYTVCGTPTYVAPEILAETGYGLPVDIWALGIITYILLCGFPPFRSPERRQSELFDVIKKGEFEYLSPFWDHISHVVYDLIDSMLIMDPRKRFRAHQVLNHKWILKHCEKRLKES